MKKERGITLIALIITIIILLILAMVTIRILMNQGIIKHAQNATEAYNDAQNNETEYLTYAEGEMDKYAGVTGGGSGTDTTAPDDLKKYFLGVNEDGTVANGRSLMEVLDTSSYPAYSFKDDPSGKSVESASTKVKFLNLYQYDSSTAAVYAKYNNVGYKVTVDTNTFVTKTLEKAYEPKGKEGTIVKYSADGSTTKTDWLVLYDNGSTLDIMSVNTMKKAEDTNGLTLGNSNLDSAIDSYNSAVATINNYCNSLITNTTKQKVRSVGTKFDIVDTTAIYSSDRTDNWQPTYNGRGKVGDINAEDDIIRMSFFDLAGSSFGYAKSDNDYWLVSRVVREASSVVYFRVRYVDSDGRADNDNSLWGVYSDSAFGSAISYAVRPVVRVAVSDVS